MAAVYTVRRIVIPLPSAPRGRLELGGGPPAEAIAAAFAAILAYARAVAGTASRDPARAVHEFRKSVRRARAIVRLVRDALPPASYRSLWATLRSCQRRTSPLRDAEVVLAALDRVETSAVTMLLAARLRARRAAALRKAPAILHAASLRLAGLPARLRGALSPALAWDDLAATLARAFRRARRGRRRTERTAALDDLHDWRKRVKELNYALELLGAGRGKLEAERRVASRLARGLGVCTDLRALDDALGRLVPGEGAALRASLARRLRRRSLRALSESEPFFERRARKLRSTAQSVLRRH